MLVSYVRKNLDNECSDLISRVIYVMNNVYKSTNNLICCLFLIYAGLCDTIVQYVLPVDVPKILSSRRHTVTCRHIHSYCDMSAYQHLL